MSLRTGSKLGPYEIQSPLGAGGMGEVYRARDTRLDRTVAIKTLPAHLSENTEARQRFEREARTISSLTHPNICQLYDIGSQDGLQYLVMEHLEGETLASRLLRGPLPLEQLVRYASDICEGLEKAHRSGVLHRDLKPGNVMLTKSGAKLMDFGLAKSIAPVLATSGFSATVDASGRHPLTAEGMLVGTFHYMSPEQVEGKEADARSDIFALGALLYEMATGRRAFEGKTAASVFAAVLERDPQSISAMQPSSPPALDRLVKACLAKDPDERWRSAYDVKLQLAGVREDLQSPIALHTAPRNGFSQKLVWGVAGVLAVAFVILLTIHLGNREPQKVAVRSSLLPPPNWSFLVNNEALSPDGTRLAFVAVASNGQTSLWVRSLSSGAEQQLSGTEGATLPFWSPDGLRLGFFADNKLKITDSNGVPPKALAEATFGRGGTWNREGVIVFAPDMHGVLYRIQDSGGNPVPLTKLPREGSGQAHRYPFFLPDGKHFLFSMDWSAPDETPGNGIYVGSIDGASPKLVTTDFTGNVAFTSGKLLYIRDLTLTVQPFDPDRLQLTGPAAPVGLPQVVTTESFSDSAFAVSDTGLLAFHAVADVASQLVWFNAKGEQTGQIATTGPTEPRLSPDGRFVAFPCDEAGNGRRYIRIYDLARDVATRVTDIGGEEAPAWSSDGKKLVYVSREGPKYGIYRIDLERPGPPEVLWTGPRVRQADYTLSDLLVFAEFSSGRPRLMKLSLKDRQVSLLHAGAEGRISPDGHWLIYTFSSGHPFRPDVYLEPFRGPGARIQISRDGGAQATWGRDGKTIFFVAPDKKMMAVSFDAVHQSVSPPRVLFQTRIIAPNFVTRQYDVAPDGRFLINSLPPGSAPPISLLTNWTEGKH